VQNIDGLPLTSANGYVFYFGAVFLIWVRSTEHREARKDSVSKDAANKAAGLNEPKNGNGVRLRYAAKEI
jgi:hypothetical protein